MKQSMTVGSLDKVNSFFQQATNQKHSIYQSNDVLSLLVSKVMVGDQDTYHVKLMKQKNETSVCLTKQICENKDELMDHFMFIKDAIF